MDEQLDAMESVPNPVTKVSWQRPHCHCAVSPVTCFALMSVQRQHDATVPQDATDSTEVLSQDVSPGFCYTRHQLTAPAAWFAAEAEYCGGGRRRGPWGA